MRFVWGRSRLPASAAEWGDMKFTIHTKHTSQPDWVYPVAHTCFHSLELHAPPTLTLHRQPVPLRATLSPSSCSRVPPTTPHTARTAHLQLHELPPLYQLYLPPLRCFFSLELPAYSSAAHCYDRLLYAITHCTQIDIDTTTAARENRDREDGED